MDNYSVYKLTSPENKVYIGMTRQKPQKRWGNGYKHNPYKSAMIAEYGWSNIHKEVIASGLSKEAAENLEARLVNEFRSTDRACGYNINRGGSGPGIVSEETRLLMARNMYGDLNPTRRFGHPMKGKRHSEESKKKMSASASARTGRVVTAETKNKLRQVQKKTPVRCVDTGVVYEGIHIAAEAAKCSATHLCAACRGRKKTAGGLRWEYVKEAT